MPDRDEKGLLREEPKTRDDMLRLIALPENCGEVPWWVSSLERATKAGMSAEELVAKAAGLEESRAHEGLCWLLEFGIPPKIRRPMFERKWTPGLAMNLYAGQHEKLTHWEKAALVACFSDEMPHVVREFRERGIL